MGGTHTSGKLFSRSTQQVVNNIFHRGKGEHLHWWNSPWIFHFGSSSTGPISSNTSVGICTCRATTRYEAKCALGARHQSKETDEKCREEGEVDQPYPRQNKQLTAPDNRPMILSFSPKILLTLYPLGILGSACSHPLPPLTALILTLAGPK